jgi:hypothetical protein
MTRYLRNRRDGWIFEWDAILARNPAVEEVTEQEAYPERFIPTEIVEKVEKRRGRKRKEEEQVTLWTDDIPEAPGYNNPELNAEASKGLPE